MIPIPKKMSKCLTAGNAERAGLLVKGEEGEKHWTGGDQGNPTSTFAHYIFLALTKSDLCTV